MADAVLHIKDSYFFEVPKFLKRYDFKSVEEVAERYPFLVKEHPDLTATDFNRDLAGKIIIPQPFATLKNLYDKESGFAISKFMILELVVAAILIFVFARVARKVSTGSEPKGKFWNFFEAMLTFVRDEMAVPAMGKHEAERFTPLLWTLFFFILGCNLMGMIPWLGTPTGAWGVTFGLAAVVFATSVVSGSKQFGLIGFWKNQVPSMDLPWWIAPLKFPIFLIEVMSLCIKHAVLSIRLLANMVAGHLVLLGILGLIVAAAASSTGQWATVTVISVVGSALFSLLELFVAFLQAFVFTLLSALFIGAAVHHH